MDKKNTVYVSLLGNFLIEYNGVQVTSNDLSNQVSSLFAFLLVNKNTVCSKTTIINSLWPDGVSNPTAALKNLAYRFRKVCESKGLGDNEVLIVSSNGSYRLNPELIFESDIFVFENSIKSALSDGTSEEEKRKLLEATVAAYQGDFCPNLDCTDWVSAVSQRFLNLFFEAAYALLDIYEKNEKWDKMYLLAKKASDYDYYEEPIHRYILKALSKMGKNHAAVNYYSVMRDVFFKEIGVELSEETISLYNEISKNLTDTCIDIHDLMADLAESETSPDTAYYCEYEIFKQLYRYQARNIRRNGTTYFIATIDIETREGKAPKRDICNKAMEHLKESISISIRKCDVFSRCSLNQFVLMVQMNKEENILVILNRIEKKYKELYHSKKAMLRIRISPLVDAGWC
ncbi:MAG: BTAD domain-containing putative transcriptional regulator [Oscillospiraceae bacterium]|nr:BTAD domain-containing putative transcriptional regulator [Oscillospiraceae bacterium]